MANATFDEGIEELTKLTVQEERELRLIWERILEEEEDRIDLKDARAALEEVKREGTIPFEQIKKELGL